jgi:membrane-associated protease RseP (regulator of RpoE activity)
MIQRSFVFVLLTASFVFVGFGQQPDSKKDGVLQTLAFAMNDDGGYLGIQTREVSKENFAKLGLSEVRGVAVEKVIENSPAAAAGLEAGDVIVRLDGEEVTSNRKLTRLIGEIAPDHRVKLTIVRGGSERELTATVGKRQFPAFENGNWEMTAPLDKITLPELKDFPQLRDIPQLKELPALKDLPKNGTPQVFTFPGGEGRTMVWRGTAGRQIGVAVSPLTKQLAQHFGVESGLMINDVRDSSPGAKAGLKAGDIIVEADGKKVNAQFDLVQLLNTKKEGDVTLKIVRDGKQQSVNVTPETSKDSGFLWQTEEENGNVLMPARPIAPRAARPLSVRPMVRARIL